MRRAALVAVLVICGCSQRYQYMSLPKQDADMLDACDAQGWEVTGEANGGILLKRVQREDTAEDAKIESEITRREVERLRREASGK